MNVQTTPIYCALAQIKGTHTPHDYYLLLKYIAHIRGVCTASVASGCCAASAHARAGRGVKYIRPAHQVGGRAIEDIRTRQRVLRRDVVRG
jgi:hypothetical protein